jgi:hypothetical protein
MKIRKSLGMAVLLICTAALAAGCEKNEPASSGETKAAVESAAATESEEKMTFTLQYYPDVDSETPSEKTTEAVYGEETPILSVEELGFTKEGYGFLGWREMREVDGKWYVQDAKGKKDWIEVKDGKLPKGYSYVLRRDGDKVTTAAKKGIVRLYAEWGIVYTIQYYPDVDSETPSDIVTTAVSGIWTPTETIEHLGFAQDGKKFVGWRVYRESDEKWSVISPEDKNVWTVLEDGDLPEGYKYHYREDGGKLLNPTTKGIVRMYAEWE